MNSSRSRVKEARAIVARSAADATDVLNHVAKSRWLSLVSQHSVAFDGRSIASLAVSLFLARERYRDNAVPQKQMSAAYARARGELRDCIKLLKTAEKTAGIFADAIAVIRSGMQSELANSPLFDDYTAHVKKAAKDPRAHAKRTALALLEQFFPRRKLHDNERARAIKLAADDLLRSVGFDIGLSP